MSITPLDVASMRPSRTSVQLALTQLDGTAKSAVSLLSGLSPAELDDLGGFGEAKPRKPYRTETPPEPVFVSYREGDIRPVVNGRIVGRFEAADMRRRKVLERDFNDAMRRRALHLRTGNKAAYRKADEQAGRYMDLIVAGIDAGRWES
jgi:hypothetical protein